MIKESNITYNSSTGALTGPEGVITGGVKHIFDTQSLYANAQNLDEESLNRINYRTEVFNPQSVEGSLQFATSYVYPGTVNGEFFMTKGHFHKIANRAEFYLCLEGEGLLVLMDRNRRWWAERMRPQSLHYIPGETAHRMVNTSSLTLVVQACWNSDAGYDYETIEHNGFSVRFFNLDGEVVVVESS